MRTWVQKMGQPMHVSSPGNFFLGLVKGRNIYFFCAERNPAPLPNLRPGLTGRRASSSDHLNISHMTFRFRSQGAWSNTSLSTFLYLEIGPATNAI